MILTGIISFMASWGGSYQILLIFGFNTEAADFQ